MRQLEYKLSGLGGVLLRVAPQYTSQKCSQCGHISKDNRKSQAKFKCMGCGFETNADHNAALNILAAGHAVSACGEAVKPGGVKDWFVAIKLPTVGFNSENQPIPLGSLVEAGTRSGSQSSKIASPGELLL